MNEQSNSCDSIVMVAVFFYDNPCEGTASLREKHAVSSGNSVKAGASSCYIIPWQLPRLELHQLADESPQGKLVRCWAASFLSRAFCFSAFGWEKKVGARRPRALHPVVENDLKVDVQRGLHTLVQEGGIDLKGCGGWMHGRGRLGWRDVHLSTQWGAFSNRVGKANVSWADLRRRNRSELERMLE